MGWHFASATLSKLTPPVVQLVLLFVVGRESNLEDVGLLALASAIAFNCGSIAEAGFNTSLSVPEAYLGEALPPLSATRRLRLLAAVGGTGLYGLLWAAGLGQHEAVLLILLPLPALLALSYGYSGVMNAAGRLGLEGRVSIGESLLALALVAPFLQVADALAAVLLALLVGRAAGTLARAVVVRRLPQSQAEHLPEAGRTHAWFVATAGSTALHGQIDSGVLGFYGSFTLLGVYGPLVRIAYSGLLAAEGLAWALYSRTTHERVQQARRQGAAIGDRLLGNWRAVGLALGVAWAAAFWLLGAPVLEFLVDHHIDGLRVPITLLSVAVLVRFGSFVFSVDIIRAGRQRARLPVELAAAAVLGGFAVVGATDDSLSVLALGKLAGELLIAGGYGRIARLPGRGEALSHA